MTGTFTTGMHEYDQKNLYTTIEAAQDLLGLQPTVISGLGVRTDDPDDATAIGEALQERLGYPYYVESWITTNQALFSALKLEKLAMGLILFLIVLVAAFNIVSTLTMVVADKTREIGILRAMGMPARSIRRIFFLQGVVVGAVGTGGGLILGLAVATLLERYHLIKLDPSVYFIDHLPVYTRFSDVLLTAVASLLIAALATLYPASQAAKLYPVEAIRHE